jgi:hypothetical protein
VYVARPGLRIPVVERTPAGGVFSHAATGLEANAFCAARQCVYRRLLRTSVRRSSLLQGDDARAMAR